jgi:hypothetical protein
LILADYENSRETNSEERTPGNRQHRSQETAPERTFPHRRSESLRFKIAEAWGVHLYNNGLDLLQDDGLVGRFMSNGESGVEELLTAIEFLIDEEGIYRYTLEIEDTGYRAVFQGRQGTKLDISYDNEIQGVIIHRYRGELEGAAAKLVKKLEESQPQRVDNYTGCKGTTLYLGVKFKTDGDEVKPTLITERTKGLDFWFYKGKRVTYSTHEKAEEDVARRIQAAAIKHNPALDPQGIPSGERVNYSRVFLVWHTNGRHVGYDTGPFYQAFCRGIQTAQSEAVIAEIEGIHGKYATPATAHTDTGK